MKTKDFLEAFGARLFSRPVVAGWAIATATLTLTGPFGTYENFAVGQRCFYWLIVVAASLVIGIGAETAVRMTLPDMSGWPETLLTGALLTVLYTPFLYVFTLWMATDRELMLSPFLMGGVVFAVPIIHRALANVVYAAKAEKDLPTDSVNDRIRPRLLRRFDDDAVMTVSHLSGRDHYVDVFTNAGKRSLLMRFSDAVDELEDVAGLRVHRSHWVAVDAMEQIQRRDNRIFLQLTGGHEVPVSRAYRKDVEQVAASGSCPFSEPAAHAPDRQPGRPVHQG